MSKTRKKKSSVASNIITGLEQAVSHARTGDSKYGRTLTVTFLPLPDYKASRVRQIRQGLNLTQKSFANLMGVSPKTVESWETGTNRPNGTARRMLSLLESEKDIVQKLEVAAK